jgi:hypothetical protein
MKKYLTLGVGLLLAALFGAACQDEVNVGKVQPSAQLSQDWDRDGKFDPLPDDPGEGDYLLDFGKVVVKQKSSRTIILANAQSAKADLSWLPDGIRLADGSSADFFVDPPPVNALAPGQSTFINVHYIPREEATDSGTLLVDTNDPDRDVIKVTLKGEGVTPDVEVCVVDKETHAEVCNHQLPAGTNLSLDFGMNELGHSSSNEFVVRNRGVYTLSLAAGGGQGGVDIPASTDPYREFSLQPGPFTGTLEPGAEKRFTVVYTPFDGGADRPRVEVTSNDPDEPVVIIEMLGNGLAPKICPQPPFLVDFGSVSVGTRSEKSFRFTSCGNQVLTINELKLDSGNHGFFTFTSSIPTPFDLSPGTTFDVWITYAPTQVGAHAGKLTIRSNDPNAGEGWVDIVGKATPIPTCDINVVPTDVNFGTVSTSGFSNKTVTIQNTGDADCQIIAIKGPNGSPEFNFPSPPSITVVPVGEMRQFTVQYRPTDVGKDTGTIEIESNDPDEAKVTINLQGEGIQPPPCDFQADPATLNFGSVPMGQAVTLSTRLWNFGSENCTIWAWELLAGSDPSFQPAAVPFPRPEVAPGTYFEIKVTLNPQSSGLMQGTLEIRAGEDPFHLVKIHVALSGGGQAARMCLNPTVLDFGPVSVGQYKDLSFDITACSSGNLKIRSVTFDGDNPDFTFAQAPGAPFTVQAGNKKTITIRYSPSDPGADFGRVAIASNDDQLPVGFVELKGNYTGNCPAVFDCQPSALTFPQLELGQSSTMAFICTNHGTEQLTVNEVKLASNSSPDYSVSAPGLPMTVKPNGELHVEVTYTPSDIGPDTGSVQVLSSFTSSGCDNFTLITIPLEAEGITPTLPECIAPRVFQPTLEWSWPNGNISNPTFNKVFMTPIVINLTDDNGDGYINEKDIPDVIFSAHVNTACMTVDCSCLAQPAMLRAISGKDGREIWTQADTRFRLNWETQIAAADIDGDNLPEILGSKAVCQETGNMDDRFTTGNILAFEHNGNFKWESEPWHAPQGDIEDGSAIGVADLDNDGHPEIFRGPSVFNHRGKLLWEGQAGRGSVGHGCFSFAADLDGDKKLELVAGNTAYRWDGTVMWQSSKADGISAVADFNLDKKPEVILFSGGVTGGIYILDGRTGNVLSQLTNTEINAIIPPVIANIDGVGGPEVGVVGTCKNPNDPDATECFWGLDINENNLAITQIWKEYIYDYTLGGGNTGFDFEGDGPFEVLQNDEQWVNIYAGLAHNQIYHASRTSVTGWELPIVVDVDNDDHAEIIVIQNGLVDKGILVYGNRDNDWVATRRIWHQFDYHITNIRENGTVPRFEVPNWTVYNNFLTNQPFCRKP